MTTPTTRPAGQASARPPVWVRVVAVAGLAGVSGYVVAWVVAGALTPGYDPGRQAISELFAIGAPAVPRGLMIASLLASGLALTAFGPALHRGLPGRGWAGPAATSLSGVMTVAVIAFPCTAGCPGAGITTTDTMHAAVAGVGYVALMSAPLFVAWRVRRQAPALAAWSVGIGAVALVGFVIRNLGVADDLAGLQQRVFNTTADVWYVVAAVWLLRGRPNADPR